MSSYSRSCFMCRSVQPRGGRAECSFHRFPSDALIRSKWLRFCNLSEVDDVSRIWLCSKHFTPADFTNFVSKQLGGYLKLKAGAVPVIRHPERRKVKQHTSIHPEKASTSSLASSELLVKEMVQFFPPKQHLVETSTLTEQLMTPCNEKYIDVSTQTDIWVNTSEDTCTVSYNKWCDASTQTETPPLTLDETVSTNTYQNETSEMEPSTPKGRKFAEPRFIGDIRTPDVLTPRRAKRTLRMAILSAQKQTKKVKALQEQRRYMKKKLNSMKDLIDHLKKKNLISDEVANSLMDGLPEHMKQMILKKKQHTRKYLPELRSFALTLQFYSAKAYNYVRRVWGKVLPHPATLRGWYRVVNGAPGFSKHAFEVIGRKDHPICNIVIDEMSIREQMLFSHGKFYGGVNLGAGLNNSVDNTELAKNALVFMAVALNGSWKVPLGYFLIKGLTGVERSNLLNKCLELMHDASATVRSVTFDGASVNLSMCTNLGANFEYGKEQFKPFFEHPKTKEKVFIFFDICHMLKLIRNTLGDQGYLFDGNESKIAWEFISNLEKLQNEEGLAAATKLSKKHVNFNDNRMNVKLAAQTLSESVCNGLKFAENLNSETFQNCEATAQFCLNFNNVFDLLNCRNKFSRDRFRVPLNEDNYQRLFEEANRLIEYIEKLKDKTKTPILQSKRKTGFLGAIICLKNMFALYSESQLEYLLTFKLSQDFLETFFSAIRGRGGWNNNPNALQFATAYKRLLVRHDIRDFENSNCIDDNMEILSVSSKQKQCTSNEEIEIEEEMVTQFDHDYVQTLWGLSPYVENVVAYISGYIASKVEKKIDCETCNLHLTSACDTPLLIKIKNRGKLLTPSSELIRICTVAEKVIRENTALLFTKTNIEYILTNTIMKRLGNTFDTEIMQQHILSQDILNNHKMLLMKFILKCYLNIRLHHESRQVD